LREDHPSLGAAWVVSLEAKARGGGIVLKAHSDRAAGIRTRAALYKALGGCEPQRIHQERAHDEVGDEA
jgi:hypothetical protein